VKTTYNNDVGAAALQAGSGDDYCFLTTNVLLMISLVHHRHDSPYLNEVFWDARHPDYLN
jgi:hypothetical protein